MDRMEGYLRGAVGRIVRWVRRAVREPSAWDRHLRFVEIHPTVIVAPEASICVFHPEATPRPCIRIGEGSHIFASFNVLRPEARITVGRNCQLGQATLISAESIAIGDDVLMAWGITIMDTDGHSVYWNERCGDVAHGRTDYGETGGLDIARSHDWSHIARAPIRIGDKCWLGFGVSILKGVTLGEGSIIGAGSVVTADVPPWTIAAGNPCRPLRSVPMARS